jgi:hypothetical protein
MEKWRHSSLGEGTAFILKLPASSRSVDAASEVIVEAKKPRVRGEMEGLHELLVDDDEMSLGILKRMLTTFVNRHIFRSD